MPNYTVATTEKSKKSTSSCLFWKSTRITIREHEPRKEQLCESPVLWGLEERQPLLSLPVFKIPRFYMPYIHISTWYIWRKLTVTAPLWHRLNHYTFSFTLPYTNPRTPLLIQHSSPSTNELAARFCSVTRSLSQHVSHYLL